MRAAAAYSTAIKNTSDMIRHTLRLDSMVESGEESLPELIVSELTQEQIEALRKVQSEEEIN